jgi:hypothetical protein
MIMETETIDRLFLELSQVTNATTRRELALGKQVAIALKTLNDFANFKAVDGHDSQSLRNLRGYAKEAIIEIRNSSPLK